MDKKWSTAFQPQTLTMIINANVIQVRIMPFKKLTHFLFIGFPQTPYPVSDASILTTKLECSTIADCALLTIRLVP